MPILDTGKLSARISVPKSRNTETIASANTHRPVLRQFSATRFTQMKKPASREVSTKVHGSSINPSSNAKSSTNGSKRPEFSTTNSKSSGTLNIVPNSQQTSESNTKPNTAINQILPYKRIASKKVMVINRKPSYYKLE